MLNRVGHYFRITARDMASKPSSTDIADIKRRIAAADWLGAFQRSNELLIDFPDTPFLLSTAHKAALQLGQLDEARSFIERALLVSPAVAAYHLLSGRLHQRQGDLEAALCAYRRATQLAPDVPSHPAAIAAVLHAQGSYHGAVANYQVALALDGTRVDWWNRLARSAMLSGNLLLALEAYAKSLALKEDFAVLAASMEVQRQVAAESKAAGEASSCYYDAIFTDSTKYAQHGGESKYIAVWKQIVDLLIAAEIVDVLDLGCGPGQFAEYLQSRTQDIRYTGLDFSEVAIKQARARCPDFLFEVVSLPNEAARLPPSRAVICTEVLEHIEKDLSVLESIPEGVRIYATVPNYDSFGHVRYFRTAHDVKKRYGPLFNDLDILAIPLSASSIIWLFYGEKSLE